MDEVHKSIDIPEAPKKNAPPGHIPLPPPPPPAGGVPTGMGAALNSLLKPLHISTTTSAGGKRAESPESSAYSPGTQPIAQPITHHITQFFKQPIIPQPIIQPNTQLFFTQKTVILRNLLLNLIHKKP